MPQKKQPPIGTERLRSSDSTSSLEDLSPPSLTLGGRRGSTPPPLNVEVASQFGQQYPPEQTPQTVTPGGATAREMANSVLETPTPQLQLNSNAPEFKPHFSKENDEQLRFLANKERNNNITPAERKEMKELKEAKIVAETGKSSSQYDSSASLNSQQSAPQKPAFQRQRSHSVPNLGNNFEIGTWNPEQSGSNSSLNSAQSDVFPTIGTWKNPKTATVSIDPGKNPLLRQSLTDLSQSNPELAKKPPGLNVTPEQREQNLQGIENKSNAYVPPHLREGATTSPENPPVAKYVPPQKRGGYSLDVKASYDNWRERTGSTSSNDSDKDLPGGRRL